jgi:hypothetical protein
LLYHGNNGYANAPQYCFYTYVACLLNKKSLYSKSNITEKFLFPAESCCLNRGYFLKKMVVIYSIWFQDVARHENRISAHLATVCSHQQHNRPHDVTGSCLIGLQTVVGSRKLMCGSNKSCPRISSRLAFAHVFQSRDHYFGCTTQSRPSRCRYVLVQGRTKTLGFCKLRTSVCYVIKERIEFYRLCAKLVSYLRSLRLKT